MSLERRRLILAYGATCDLIPREKGTNGAIERVEELLVQTPSACMPQQFQNPANIEIHLRTTAREILDNFANAPIDAIITRVGTGGHITGVARVLKQAWPGLKVYAVEPPLSLVISGGQSAPHSIQGIGAGFLPANLNNWLLDGVIQVDPVDAKAWALRSASHPEPRWRTLLSKYIRLAQAAGSWASTTIRGSVTSQRLTLYQNSRV